MAKVGGRVQMAALIAGAFFSWEKQRYREILAGRSRDGLSSSRSRSRRNGRVAAT